MSCRTKAPSDTTLVWRTASHPHHHSPGTLIDCLTGVFGDTSRVMMPMGTPAAMSPSLAARTACTPGGEGRSHHTPHATCHCSTSQIAASLRPWGGAHLLPGVLTHGAAHGAVLLLDVVRLHPQMHLHAQPAPPRLAPP